MANVGNICLLIQNKSKPICNFEKWFLFFTNPAPPKMMRSHDEY